MVGREIVEEEQQGLARAGYAERVVALLSERLGMDYGAGYSAQNLAHMKQFYVAYPMLMQGGMAGEDEIFHAMRGKLKGSPRKALKAATGSGTEGEVGLKISHAVRGEFDEGTEGGYGKVLWGMPQRGAKADDQAWKI